MGRPCERTRQREPERQREGGHNQGTTTAGSWMFARRRRRRRSTMMDRSGSWERRHRRITSTTDTITITAMTTNTTMAVGTVTRMRQFTAPPLAPRVWRGRGARAAAVRWVSGEEGRERISVCVGERERVRALRPTTLLESQTTSPSPTIRADCQKRGSSAWSTRLSVQCLLGVRSGW